MWKRYYRKARAHAANFYVKHKSNWKHDRYVRKYRHSGGATAAKWDNPKYGRRY